MRSIDNFKGDYFFLSNFYQAPVFYSGLLFENAEAAFQSAKCPDRMEKFCHLNPSAAKRLGRRVELRADWNEVKDQIITLQFVDQLSFKDEQPSIRAYRLK